MKTITLKGIPEGLYRALKRRAESHRRSLNAEVLHSLEHVVGEREYTADELLARIDRVRERVALPFLSADELRAARSKGRA